MHINKILMIGCGRLGTLAAHMLQQHAYKVVGARRSISQIPKDIPSIRLDLADLSSVAEFLVDWSVIVIAISPGKSSEEAYRKTYFTGVQNLLIRLSAEKKARADYKAPLIIFISSTSVYGQNDGSLVDEASKTQPENFSGKILLETERLLYESNFAHCVIRFTGIYGSVADHMTKKLLSGKIYRPLPEKYSNRIHIEDCARMILHLIERYFELGYQAIKPCYIGVDHGRATVREMMEWLAQKYAVDVGSLTEIDPPTRGGNKRCSNALICAEGFEFKFKDYRSGY